MRHSIGAVLLLSGSLAASSAPVHAQHPQACGDRADLIQQLADKFHEAPTGIGITTNGTVVELFTSDSGSWTLILSFPNGRSCLMAAGEGWDMAPPRLPGRET